MSGQETDKVRKNENNPNARNSNIFLLSYRWIIFLFSVIFCVSGLRLDSRGYAVIESLALAFVYNCAATVAFSKHGRKYASLISYLDVIALSLLLFFSGGINSELYVFLFFILGFASTNNDVSAPLKVAVVSVLLYSAVCIYSDKMFSLGMNYVTVSVRGILFLLAAFAICKFSYEVKKYDEMRKREFRIARTDKLTGLANRHYFDQKLKDEVEYVKRTGAVLNILMFDIDNFKGFNDRYGHVQGDKLLALFANIIKQCIRNSDIPVRYGGEEFLILIRDLDIFLAKSVAERIRKQLEKQRIYIENYNNRLQVTVSCGVAQYPAHSTDIREVIERADNALYYAKSIGKNIVVSYDEIGLDRGAIENGMVRR